MDKKRVTEIIIGQVCAAVWVKLQGLEDLEDASDDVEALVQCRFGRVIIADDSDLVIGDLHGLVCWLVVDATEDNIRFLYPCTRAGVGLLIWPLDE